MLSGSVGDKATPPYQIFGGNESYVVDPSVVPRAINSPTASAA
jgi:hypothetical protein